MNVQCRRFFSFYEGPVLPPIEQLPIGLELACPFCAGKDIYDYAEVFEATEIRSRENHHVELSGPVRRSAST